MKKKIINGLLFAVAMVAATSSFVSCKDYEGDNYAEFQEKYASLQAAYDKQVQAMRNYVLTHRYDTEVGTGYSHELTIIERLAELETDTASLADRIHKNNLAIAALSNDTIKPFILAWGKDLNAAIDEVARVRALADTTSKWQEEWKRAVSVADSARTFVSNAAAKDGTKFEKLQDLVDYYEKADSALQEQINALKADVKKLSDAYKAKIDNVIVQAVYNPIWGCYSYPFNFESNVLAAYYGEFDTKVFFPAGDGDYADFWVDPEHPAVLSDELEAINATIIPFEKGIVIDESAGNAGKLFLTVTPGDVDITGKEFTLSTYLGKVSKVELSPLEAATEELYFGHTRAAAQNGAYVAKATIKKADAKDVSFSIDVEGTGLKSQISSLLKDWTNKSAKDFVKLGLDVYNVLDQAKTLKLGMKTSYQDSIKGWTSSMFDADIAAMSIRPLSYKTLWGANYSEPIVKVQTKLDGKMKAFSKELQNMINISIDLPEGATGDIIKTTDGKYLLRIKLTDGQFGTVDFTALETAVKSVPGITYTGNIGKVNLPQGAKTVDVDITGLFNALKKVETALGKASNKIDTYMNKIINTQNKIFNKVAAVASNPNRYIQPALLGKSSTMGYFYPSRSHLTPTQVQVGTKISFYPTSLTGEVIAPAYKKYVAFVGGWDVNDVSKTIDIKDYNKAPFNTVVDGKEYNMTTPIEFTVPDVPGNVLEIIYECLDYTGKVSGKKYYIEVYK